ncbi:MAG: hypothetical protein DIJKHBIC_02223 [Thermoanaerobaculia bacterium]|nr:hypothetical protein [Thermoanaerobaculia bacterium]
MDKLLNETGFWLWVPGASPYEEEAGPWRPGGVRAPDLVGWPAPSEVSPWTPPALTRLPSLRKGTHGTTDTQV